MSRVTAKVGETANTYQVLSKLGAGGMAEVFLARGATRLRTLELNAAASISCLRDRRLRPMNEEAYPYVAFFAAPAPYDARILSCARVVNAR